MKQTPRKRRNDEDGLNGKPGSLDEGITISMKNPKLEIKCKTTKWKPLREEELRVLKITFEYGPLPLNTYQYVFDGLKDVWEMSRLCAKLNEPDESFLLITDTGQDVKKLCRELFSSIPTIREIPLKNIHEELLHPKPLLVCLGRCSILQKETSNFISSAVSVESDFLFLVSDENSSIKNLAKSGLHCKDANVLSRGRKSHDHFYYVCNEVASKWVSDYLEILCKKMNTRTNSRCLKLLQKYRNEIEMTMKRSTLNKKVVNKVDKAVKKVSKIFPLLGYALSEGALKLFARSEIRLFVPALIQNVRSFLNDCFHGRIIAELLKKPYIMPFSALQGGCKLTSGTISGTLGMFARRSIENGSETIAISSGHVAHKGSDVIVELEEELWVIGRCIWPEPTQNNANVKDISVIMVKPDIVKNIKYRFPESDVRLPDDDLEEFHNRRVFKFGAKTNETKGHIKCTKKSDYLGAEVMCIEPKDKKINFSEPGDSGAVVFTKYDEDLIAIGIVLGDKFTEVSPYSPDEESQEETEDAHYVAINFKKAIELFESDGKGQITLEKF